jgi:mono/diheme cytochrome c family protein/glucose/arabinose dehydrogenase
MNKKHFLIAIAAGSVALASALWAASPSPAKPARRPAAKSGPAAAAPQDLPEGNVNANSNESYEPKFTINSPPAPYLPPDQALKTLKLPPGFHAELVASEPMVEIPVTMQFDPDGRLWVVEMRAYMPNVMGQGEDQPIGRISVLEDTDGDGKMDKSTVFLDGLVMPRAIGLVNGGALIGTPPKVIFAKDTNGDGKADDVKTVFTGYGVSGNPEHKDNGLMWAMDNWIYNAKSSKRFRLKDGKWVESPTYFRGQWGISQDDLGRLYYNSNSDVLRMDVTPSEYLTRNPNFTKASGIDVQPGGHDQTVWPGRVNYGVNRGYKDGQLRADGTLATVTAACAPMVYRGDLFPEEFRGNVFVCEPSGNCVMRKVMSEHDLVPTSHNPYHNTEFLTSTDERFRPVNLFTGPDGAIYVVDIYHGILQHKTYETPYLIKQIKERALDKNNRKGRIWRIVPDGANTAAKPRPHLSAATTAQLVDTLNHPNGWWRDTAQQLLVEKADPAAVPLLNKLVASAKSPITKLHALWTLHGMNKLTPDVVSDAFADADPHVRATAIRVAEVLLPADAKDNNGELFDQIVERVTDAAPEVQLQLACTLSGLNKPEAMDATGKVIKRNLHQAYIRDAAVAGLRGREMEFAEQLLADKEFSASASADRASFLEALGMCVAGEHRASRVSHLLDRIAALPASAAWEQAALLDGLAGDPRKKIKKSIQLDAEPATLVALQKSPDTKVAEQAARLASLLIWPGKPGYKEIKITPLTTDQQALFEKGKVLYSQTCAACHQPNGQGQEGLAPPLVDSQWVEGPHTRVVRIVLNGLKGPVDVNGSQFDLEMPAMELVFDDDMIAALLTYIRREWDHHADPVSVDQVRAVRAQVKGRPSQWTAPELEKVK